MRRPQLLFVVDDLEGSGHDNGPRREVKDSHRYGRLIVVLLVVLFLDGDLNHCVEASRRVEEAPEYVIFRCNDGKLKTGGIVASEWKECLVLPLDLPFDDIDASQQADLGAHVNVSMHGQNCVSSMGPPGKIGWRARGPKAINSPQNSSCFVVDGKHKMLGLENDLPRLVSWAMVILQDERV